MKNPYINLLIQGWCFAQEKRVSFILAIALFVISNAFILMQPYIFGQVLNTIQKGGPDMWYGFVFYLFIYSILPFFFWVFHGYGRIIERTAAFYVGKNFKEYIFSIITELPFAWHSDNHSGETINKLSKASGALERFSGRNYIYIETIVRFIGSLVGIALISGYSSILAIVTGITILGIIRLFDKKLI